MILVSSYGDDGSVMVVHEELNHSTVVPFDNVVKFVTTMHPVTGLPTTDIDKLMIKCPVPGCGGETTHPVSGGGAPPVVQEMALRLLARTSTSIPGLPARIATANRPILAVASWLRNRVENKGGRFQIAQDRIDRARLQNLA